VFVGWATAAAPDWPWAWYHQGLIDLADKKFDSARRGFDPPSERGRGLAMPGLNRARAGLHLAKRREAIADLDAALEMESRPRRIYFVRALARLQLGDADGARADQAEGMKREPGDELGWVTRAVAFLPNEPAKALADLEQALKLNPSSPQAL